MKQAIILTLVGGILIAGGYLAINVPGGKNIMSSPLLESRNDALQKADTLIKQEKFREAEAVLVKESARFPKDNYIKRRLGDVYVALGENRRAYDSYKTLFKPDGRGPEDVKLNYVFSELCRKQGDLVGQQFAYERILARRKRELENDLALRKASVKRAEEGAPQPISLWENDPSVVAMTKTADGTLTNEAMVQVYAMAANAYYNSGDETERSQSQEIIRKAVALNTGSVTVRYGLASMCGPDLKTEKKALLNYVVMHGSPLQKELALSDLGIKAMGNTIWSKPVVIKSPPHVVAEFKESVRKRQEELNKRARQWDPVKKRPMPWPSEARAKPKTSN